ncbi:CXADR-like membrane protein [Labeo rohita]|uniref:CXADR-like membrane protein n=1 Tax=Labeo rohita TaxID=84645 RepID=UPI0021E251A0|nr:CXADR-like membrane protein [Labeo rohita]
MNSCCFICVFAVLITKVCLQVTVQAVIGGSVLLPCSSTEDNNKIESIDVSWRHNGSKAVFDIIPHSTAPVTQDPDNKNRVETFPLEYLKGNFSIKLNNLQHTDAGQYICYITHSSEYHTVQLIINESISTDQGNQGEMEQEEMRLSLPLLLVCIMLPVMLLIVVIILILVFRAKKCSISHKAAGNGVVSATRDVVSSSTQYDPVKTDNHDESVDK